MYKIVNNRRVIIMSGHTSSGKTTVSKKLASLNSYFRVSTEEIRKREFPYLTDNSDFMLGNPKYRNTSERIYSSVIKEVEKLANSTLNHSIIVVDGSFPFASYRKDIYELCGKLGFSLVIIKCICSDEKEIIKRMRTRQSAPELHPTERARDMRTYLDSLQAEPINKKEFPDNLSVSVVEVDTYSSDIRILVGSLITVGAELHQSLQRIIASNNAVNSDAFFAPCCREKFAGYGGR